MQKAIEEKRVCASSSLSSSSLSPSFSSNYRVEDEAKYLESYFQETNSAASSSASSSSRVYCCKTSRSLYCPEYYRCLVPKKFWPKIEIEEDTESSSSFPFKNIDIILGVKERRASSTGIQFMSICRMLSEAKEQNHNIDGDGDGDHAILTASSSSASSCSSKNKNSKSWEANVNLYDLNRGEGLPSYNDNSSHKETTFVLFPLEGVSVPIHTVAEKIKKLIILDMKWSRSGNNCLFRNINRNKRTPKEIDSDDEKNGHGRNDSNTNVFSSLEGLKFVHLESPPRKSNFWRWHNRGEGMLSTIEAIYFAAREVSVTLEKRQRKIFVDNLNNADDIEKNKFINNHDHDNDSARSDQQRRCSYIDILWLFSLQRSIIEQRSIEEERPVAFSEEAKSLARALRIKSSICNTTIR